MCVTFRKIYFSVAQKRTQKKLINDQFSVFFNYLCKFGVDKMHEHFKVKERPWKCAPNRFLYFVVIEVMFLVIAFLVFFFHFLVKKNAKASFCAEPFCVYAISVSDVTLCFCPFSTCRTFLNAALPHTGNFSILWIFNVFACTICKIRLRESEWARTFILYKPRVKAKETETKDAEKEREIKRIICHDSSMQPTNA